MPSSGRKLKPGKHVIYQQHQLKPVNSYFYFMKPTIINILPHIPDYDFKKDDPKPKVNWDTPDGHWVGIYRNEIPNKLGREVLMYTDEFEYEVWQPDYRADKIYSHRFEDGLVHRLFPAKDIVKLHGLKKRNKVHSPAMVRYLKEYSREKRLVINLNGDFKHLSYQILEKCGDLPILQTFRGTINLPQSLIFKKRLNMLASVSYLKQYLKTKKLIDKVDFVTHQNDLHMDVLSKIYYGPVAKLTSGCDFSFWQKMDKQACRQELGLPQNKKMFFTSSLLISRKQKDKLLEVFKALDDEHDFMLVISGHGTNEYEAYLREVAKPLLEKDKVRFVGYITGETLKKYYSASDLFINPSRSEGGPVSSMKAIACETPVFSTNIGHVAEEMRKNKSGILVSLDQYDQWKTELEKFLEGKEVKKFDRKEAELLYDWQIIAARFSDIYLHLYENYYIEKEAAVAQ